MVFLTIHSQFPVTLITGLFFPLGFPQMALNTYYVHCMAHRLQLALVTAFREVKDIHQFFDHLVNIINIVVASSKRNDEF